MIILFRALMIPFFSLCRLGADYHLWIANALLPLPALSQVELCGQEKPFINDHSVWY